jgi:plasmid stabilization system protein ParE
MSQGLIVTPEAEADLAEAKAWYERLRAGLGEQFVLCVEEALDRIRLFPEAYREVAPGVRRAIVRRFPYGVYYRTDLEKIAVIAFYHCKRDPRGWQERI